MFMFLLADVDTDFVLAPLFFKALAGRALCDVCIIFAGGRVMVGMYIGFSRPLSCGARATAVL